MSLEDSGLVNEQPIVLEELTSDGEGSGMEVEKIGPQDGPE
jgi:hypothetical protein